MIKRFSRYDLSRLLIPVAAALLLLTSGARGVDIRSGIANDGNGATVTDGFSGRLANATIRGYTFTSRGLILGGSSNVVITDCVFRDLNERAIDYFGGMSDVTVRRCKFLNIRADGAILGWNAVRCHVDDNYFDNCHEGYHGFYGGSRSGPDNTTILRNEFRRIAHFALEQQGNPNGLDIGFNFVDDWVPQPSQMGFSIATGGDHGGIAENPPDTSHRVRVHDNFIGGATLRSSEQDAFAAFELMGIDVECDHNLVIGTWDAAFLVGLNSPAAKLHDNVLCGVRRHLDNQGIAPEDRYQAIPAANLTNNRFLSVDAMAAPLQTAVLAGTLPWQSGRGGGITPATSRPAIADLSGKATAPGVLMFAWTPVSFPLHYVVRATNGPSLPNQAEGDIPAGASSVIVGQVPNNWQMDCILSQSGTVIAKSTVQYLDAEVPSPATRPMQSTLTQTIRVFGDGSVEVQAAGK